VCTVPPHADRETDVTCPELLPRDAAAGHVTAPAEPALEGRESRRRPGGPIARLRGDDAVAQYCRFLLVGSLSSLLYATAFLASERVGDQAANVLGAALSSLLANELHRRLTFRADDRVGWFTAQWEGGALALVGVVLTGLALAWLGDESSGTGTLVRLLLIGVITGTVGAVRFLALRWMFVPHAERRG
jgi:putative flippase GtrA